MIIQRRKFLTLLASSLAAPAIVKAANIMPVKAIFDSEIVMKQITDYVRYDNIVNRLDILYGSLSIGDVITFSDFEQTKSMYTIKQVDLNEMYLKYPNTLNDPI